MTVKTDVYRPATKRVKIVDEERSEQNFLLPRSVKKDKEMTLSTNLLRKMSCFGFSLVLAASASLFAQETPAPTPKNPPLFKGDKPKKDEGLRTVSGVVRDAEDKLRDGAVVKLKDTKSLSIRSYITKPDGEYSFQGLSVGIDYELRAETREGTSSPVKILSVYDNRREAVMNLKLEVKK